MADLPESFEQRLWELLAARRLAEEASDHQDRVIEATVEALGQIAHDQYPGLGNWEPEQLRELADSIALYAKLYAGDLEQFRAR
jgi:hypothetical protein